MQKSLAILAFSAVFPALAAVNVPLTVKEAVYPGSTAGVARSAEPLTVGVPLPDSAGVSNTSALGLTGATAGQFMVEGRWPSGNIKWVKVRAIVPSLPAGGTANVTLTNGSGNFGGADLATDNGATITVNTGSATFTIKKANFNGIDQAVIGSTTVVAAGRSQGLVVIGPDPTAAYPGNVTCLPTAGGSACTTVYSSANDPSSTAVIEENGPAVAVIKATGAHLDTNGHTYMRFTARLYFFKGKSYVKVTSVLQNADYGTSNTFQTAYKGFQGYELRLGANLTGTLSYQIANHTSSTTGTLNATGGTDNAYIYQAESTLMKPGSWCSGTGCVTPSTLSGYSIVKNGTALTTGTGSQYPQGWADISDASGAGIEIGQYQFAAYGNKSLEFRNGGTDVRIGIWAAENNTTSTSATTANRAYYMPYPQHSINDVYINFHSANLSAAADEFLKLQHSLLARASTTYYNSTGAFFYPLLDPAEEDSFYSQAVSAATPAVPNWTLADLGTVDNYNYPLNVWRFYAWSAGGASNQAELRMSRLFNFLRRGQSGSYLDAAHFYKMVAETSFPRADGFSWASKSAAETQYFNYPTATRANASLGMDNWIELSQEHAHWYGMPDYYMLSGDETFKDAILNGPKEHYANTISTNNLISAGKMWNARAAGTVLMATSRLQVFLQSIGDTAGAAVMSQRAQTVWNLQVKPDLCVSGYPAGCTPSLDGTSLSANQRGTSRVRGVTYQWGETVQLTGCTYAPNRSMVPLMNGILLQGLWELRQTQGPGWADYTTLYDVGYGIAQGTIGEMYVDDGTSSWGQNGFRFKQILDFPNACGTAPGGQYRVINPDAYWPLWYFSYQYLGTGIQGWQRKVTQDVQSVFASGVHDELYHYTIANLIHLMNHPNSQTLTTVPITGFVSNGAGSYTITWAVPANAQSYRIKWGNKQIVDWIGYDSSAGAFTGDPVNTMNWFAATDATAIPAPSGTTQSLTISTGVSGLTAANFMIKAYVGGSGSTPPPPASDTTPPAVSITSPAAGATLTGSVVLTANATDNAGVANVQFLIDGSPAGSAVTGAGPSYTFSWTSTAASNGTHTVSAIATDTSGNKTTSASVSVTVNNTSAAPAISAISATGLTTSAATITWATDVASDTQVAYGTTSAYGLTTPLSTSMVTSHTAALSGLAPGTTYHFKVMSKNAQGTLGASGDFTFTTAAQPSSPPAGGTGGTAVTLKDWTSIIADGFPAQAVGYDKTVYVSSRKLHCIWGSYHQVVSSEPNDAMGCYSFAENRWSIMQNNGVWHTEHDPSAGHTTGIWAYVPTLDSIFGMTDGSGSNSPERMLGHWWQFDMGGLIGQDREFSPRPWLGVSTPDSAMAYDAYNARLVLFPDANGKVELCDPVANTCSAPATSGTAAPQVGNVSLVYNTNDHKLYLYGGGQASIYTFDAATKVWTKLTTTCSGADCVNGAPPTRRAAGFAYSTRDNVFLMAGGVDSLGGTPFFDTWIFDPTTLAWTQQNTATKYANDGTNATFDRVSYDEDSNVFLLFSSGGANNYSGGVYNSYSMKIWAYAYTAAQNYGRVLNTYTPPTGSLNRVSPTANSQSWSFDPAITASGSTVYTGWIETGASFDASPCGMHHPYVQSATSISSWTLLPGGGCTGLDPEPANSPGYTDGSRLHLAVVNGQLWETHEKWNGSMSPSAWAKSWNGSAWTGGQVGCFSGACSSSITQRPEALVANGSSPVVAVIEENHNIFVTEAYLYVARWNSGAWSPLGGKLNINGSGSRVLFASVATDGSNPAACWSEEVASSRSVISTTPQIQCAQWNGSAWARMGTGSLNRSASAWATSPSMTYAGGKFYTAWAERTTSGVSKVYACRWDAGSCTQLGAGALNVSAAAGWATHPSLATDGTNVYLAWEEQSSSGQKSLGYVKKWDGSTWSPLGGTVNADPANGSVQGISLAVVQGAPTAIWTELTFGNLRQTYVKQWNGTAWTGASGTSTAPPPAASACDLNGDGKVDSADVQLAIDQALGVRACSNADLQGIGQCTVVGVQRVVNATTGAACKVGP